MRVAVEPMALMGEKVCLVGHGERCEEFVERAGVGDRDDCVGFAVKDQRRWEVVCGLGGVGFDEAARDVDECSDASAGGWIRRGGKCSGKCQREEASERDADESDAFWVDVGPGCCKGHRGVESIDPLRNVDAVADGGEVGADGAGTVEVVRGIKGDAKRAEVGREAVEPEADVTTSAVHENHRRVRRGRRRFVHVDANVAIADAESGLHLDWMRRRARGIEKGSGRMVGVSDFLWLLIDSCGPDATLAVGRGAMVLAIEVLPAREFSAGWPGALRSLLSEAGVAIGALQVVGVVHGPGSFTGMRVGLAAAKGLCEAKGMKLCAISRLEILQRLGDVGALAVLDAGRDEFYVRESGKEFIWTRDELKAGYQDRDLVTADARVAAVLDGGDKIALVALGATSALPILLERWSAGIFDSVATADANYVRGEHDIYPRRSGAVASAG